MIFFITSVTGFQMKQTMRICRSFPMLRLISLQILISVCLTTLCMPKGNPLKSIMTYSEDLNEMPQNAAFHQGLHYLLRNLKGIK